MKQETLVAHNRYREHHGIPDLTFTKELCDMAETYAKVCTQLYMSILLNLTVLFNWFHLISSQNLEIKS